MAENNQELTVKEQGGVELAIAQLVEQNQSLLPANAAVDRIKASAGFYVVNRDDLMKLTKDNKMIMLFGILKEAMIGCEAGTDFDIIPFKGKPTIMRKKEGWYKIIDLIKPAEVVKNPSGVIFEGDDYDWNPVKEELNHTPKNACKKEYKNIVGAYAYIKFANGFEKTVFMSKEEIDAIKKMSPSGASEYSPWNAYPIKMVKTKIVKELAKELFTLWSGRINPVIANAIDADENIVTEIDGNGNIKTQYINVDSEKETEYKAKKEAVLQSIVEQPTAIDANFTESEGAE
jgi:phage RecT family recombinase